MSTTKKMKYKKGEIKDIKRWHKAGQTISYMAKELDRPESSVIVKVSDLGLTVSNEEDGDNYEEVLRAKLHEKDYWSNIKEQFTEKELIYFESAWISLLMQFREDVLYAEELQIKQLITIDILIGRSMKERKKHIEDVERFQILVDDEHQKDKTDRDIAILSNLEQQLSFARNAIGSYTTEYTKLLDKQQSISKDLKATRDQRIKRIEDSKGNFASWLKMLEDETIRERVGDEMEIMKIATDKARQDLSEYHEYNDGEVDQPFLTADTMKEDNR